ncbi:unnamed protein product [Arabis nemorensis]|uniref:Uncharacterized protein n=1 Tax=Arabis nemorensis TaxID=586526 RepID=A0A565CMU5_9BRAS|nr:unnamed protein product [Arabis nemorensis]
MSSSGRFSVHSEKNYKLTSLHSRSALPPLINLSTLRNLPIVYLIVVRNLFCSQSLSEWLNLILLQSLPRLTTLPLMSYVLVVQPNRLLVVSSVFGMLATSRRMANSWESSSSSSMRR